VEEASFKIYSSGKRRSKTAAPSVEPDSDLVVNLRSNSHGEGRLAIDRLGDLWILWLSEQTCPEDESGFSVSALFLRPTTASPMAGSISSPEKKEVLFAWRLQYVTGSTTTSWLISGVLGPMIPTLLISW
jgi:hypothetical protein